MGFYNAGMIGGGGGGGGGGVTSVGLALPASVFNVSGTPVTAAGTLTGAFRTQTTNLVFASDDSGGTTVPSFRALVAADLPGSGAITINTGTATATGLTGGGSVALGGTLTPSVALTFIPTWTGTHTFSKAGITTAQTNAIVLSNLTASTVTVQQQYSPVMTLTGTGWSPVDSVSEVASVGLQVQPVVAGVVYPELAFYSTDNNGTAKLAKMLLDRNSSIATLDFISAAGILRTLAANSIAVVRGNPTDAGGNVAVQLAGAAGVTYTGAAIVSVDNPAGTSKLTVNFNGKVGTNGGIDVLSAGQFALATGLATSVLVGGSALTGTTTVKNNGGSAAALTVDSAAAFANGQDMLTVKNNSVTQGGIRNGTGSAYPQFYSASHALGLYNDNVDGILLGNNTMDFLIGGNAVLKIDNSSYVKWVASREQTTVGAAGGASVIPLSPTTYLQVRNSAGTTLVIPAFAAS